ncbi:hypothetical protein, partial [Escherichia coli]|uniref:hypothetical protein n=1 Tax=Escherichia coli TaxID=562 RepID=UPI003FA0A70E
GIEGKRKKHPTCNKIAREEAGRYAAEEAAGTLGWGGKMGQDGKKKKGEGRAGTKGSGLAP